MDPELARQAIEGFTNELAPEARSLEAFYRQFACLRCKSSCQKEFVQGHVFADPDVLVPRSCLRCTVCRCLFDPHSGLVLSVGDAPPMVVPVIER
jgi:hypothetical protein